MGYMPSDLFFKEATFCKKGEVNSTNNFKQKCDVYDIEYKDLYSVLELRG